MRNQQPHPEHPRFDDLTGLTFGRLTVLFYVGRSRSNSCWRARCVCGVEVQRPSPWLKKSESCGCQQRVWLSKQQTTHGYTRNGHIPAEFYIWESMIRRCRDEKCKAFKWYGGRGIQVCDRWLNGADGLTAFECFLKDIPPRPSRKHSIDRWPDNDGNYEPGNVRWATQQQQQRNRRSNRLVPFKGEMIPLTEAAERIGINSNTVWGRLKIGWSIEDALNKPLRGAQLIIERAKD